MKTAAQTTFAERLGRTLGRTWRSCACLDRRAQDRPLARGWTPGAAKAAVLVVKFAALGVLAYVAFWLVVFLTLVVVAGAWAARNHDQADREEWAIGDQAEHKRSPFYDPINYDDDPDPRFDDER